MSGRIFLNTRLDTFSKRQNFLDQWHMKLFNVKNLTGSIWHWKCGKWKIQRHCSNLDCSILMLWPWTFFNPKHNWLSLISSHSSMIRNISLTSPERGSSSPKPFPARHTPCQQPKMPKQHHNESLNLSHDIEKYFKLRVKWPDTGIRQPSHRTLGFPVGRAWGWTLRRLSRLDPDTRIRRIDGRWWHWLRSCPFPPGNPTRTARLLDQDNW